MGLMVLFSSSFNSCCPKSCGTVATLIQTGNGTWKGLVLFPVNLLCVGLFYDSDSVRLLE